MTKYYINQKFSLRDRFTILDENQEDAFVAEGKFLSLGKRIKLFTMAGEELLFIKQKVLTILSQYDFYIGEEHLCEMKQEFTFFKKRYNIVTPAWRIEGDVWSLNYEIVEGNQVIARIQKKWFSWMDAYEIDIFEEDYTELLLGIVIAIDADLENSGSE